MSKTTMNLYSLTLVVAGVYMVGLGAGWWA